MPSTKPWAYIKLTHTVVDHSWGESAGAFSVAAHMAWNEGNPEGLFRAGVMVCLPFLLSHLGPESDPAL